MKILHINAVNAGGGLEQYLSQLFMHLNDRGHANLFLYGEHITGQHPPLLAKKYLISGIAQFHAVHMKEKLRELQQVIDTEKPDIVFIHQVLQNKLIEHVTRILPSVRFVHGFKLVCPEGKKVLHPADRICHFPLGYLCQIHAYLYRCMPRNPFVGLKLLYKCKHSLNRHKERSFIVVASHFMKTVLLYNDFPEAKIRVIPYFTDLPSKEINSAIPEPAHILAIGRITREKGFDYLIRAYSAIQERTNLIIVGDGPDLLNLKRLAEKLKISSKVMFPGWLSHEKLDRLYRQCAVLVVPSIWPEPFGIVGIEAMAYAKPVIAFDVGGISDWLKNDQTGYLVKPRDESALTEALARLLDNPSLAQRMGIQGRAIVENTFTSGRHIHSLLQLFDMAIHQFSQNCG